MKPGVSFYVGRPRQGKTYLALSRCRQSRAPTLAIDSTGQAIAKERALFPHPLAADWREACRMIWGQRRSCRIIPRQREVVDAIAAVCLERCGPGKGIELLVDEISLWTLPSWCPPNLDALLRTAAHPECHIHLTTQTPQGFTRRLMQVFTRVYCFRLDDDEAIAPLRMFRHADGARAFPPELVSTLTKRKYLEWSA